MADTPDLMGSVAAVHRAAGHQFSKDACESVTLLAGLGVEGDAHLGATVKHRSRFASDSPRSQRNAGLLGRERGAMRQRLNRFCRKP